MWETLEAMATYAGHFLYFDFTGTLTARPIGKIGPVLAHIGPELEPPDRPVNLSVQVEGASIRNIFVITGQESNSPFPPVIKEEDKLIDWDSLLNLESPRYVGRALPCYRFYKSSVPEWWKEQARQIFRDAFTAPPLRISWEQPIMPVFTAGDFVTIDPAIAWEQFAPYLQGQALTLTCEIRRVSFEWEAGRAGRCRIEALVRKAE